MPVSLLLFVFLSAGWLSKSIKKFEEPSGSKEAKNSLFKKGPAL
jgi:hypothetical protein